MATAEAKVIAAVCKNKDISSVIGEDPELFGPYAEVFEYMRSQYLKHKYVPDSAVLEEKFEDVEFPDTSSPTAFYLDELKNDFVTQRLQTLIKKAAAGMGTMPIGEVVEKLGTATAKLGKYTNTARDVDITDAELAKEHFDKVKIQADANGGAPGIATGFKSIDSAYSTGLAPGHLMVVMGFTGKMKSLWSDLLAVKVWEQGKKPMIISLEMSPEEQRERIYALMNPGHFRISDLSRGDVSEDDFRQFKKNKLDEGPPFVIVSSEGVQEVTPNFVQAKIEMHRPDIVILDYMQLMKDNAKSGQMTQRMMNLSRENKMLAMSNRIPVVAITAVTDEDGDKRDSPPVLSQVSWSSAIEYDANMVIAVHKHEDSDVVEMACRKNRHGPLFNFGFQVDADQGIWEEKFDLF